MRTKYNSIVWVVLFSIAAPLSFAASAIAADVTVETNKEMGCNLRLDGQIGLDDLSKVEGALEKYGKTQQGSNFPLSPRICLNSPGGSFNEALKIAELFLTYSAGVETAVPRDAVCESACAVLFMSGRRYVEASRFLHPLGRLGFHAPAIDAESLPDQLYSAQHISQSYALALSSIAEIVRLRTDLGYNFPESLLEEFLRTPPQEMRYVKTIGEAARWGIEIFPVAYPREITPLQWANACENSVGRLRDLAPRDHSVRQGVKIEAEGYEPMPELIEAKPSSTGTGGQFSIHYLEGQLCVYEFENLILQGDPGWIKSEFREALFRYNHSARISITGSWDNPSMESQVVPFLFLNPATKLVDVEISEPYWEMAESFGQYLARIVGSGEKNDLINSCWLTSTTARITNVNEYVNLRRQPDFSAPVVRQVPLGEQVHAARADNITVIGQERDRQSCIKACQAFGANSEDGNARDRVQQCIGDNMLWYKITDARGNRGWVSRKFLEEVQ